MPAFPQARPIELAHRHPWLWGVYFGILVGGAVVVVSAAVRGFRPGLLLVGLVLLLVFGGLGLLGGLFRRYSAGGPT